MVRTNNNDTKENAGPNGTTKSNTSSSVGDNKNSKKSNNKGVLLITSTEMDSIKTANSQFGLLLIKELVLPFKNLLEQSLELEKKVRRISFLEMNPKIIPYNVRIKPILTKLRGLEDTVTLDLEKSSMMLRTCSVAPLNASK